MKTLILLFVLSSLFAQTKIDSVLSRLSFDSTKLVLRELTGDTTCIINNNAINIYSRNRFQHGNYYAKVYIASKFNSYGFETEWDTLTLGPPYRLDCVNIIGTKNGYERSDIYFYIGAHFDSMPYGTIAPGADDNASGVSAVIELARVLSKFNFRYSLRFIAFDQEEEGMWGSSWHSLKIKQRNDSVLGIIVMDMIGFDSSKKNTVYVYSDTVSNSKQIRNEYISSLTDYNINLQYELMNQTGVGDAWSFSERGYGSLSLAEAGKYLKNPNYHKITDNIYYLNLNYLFNIMKGAAITAVKFVDKTTTNVLIEDNFKPDNFSLSQNFPNPFNPTTKISYSIKERGLVTLKLYDILGKEVMTLVNEIKDNGTYEVNLNARNLSSGVYLYTIHSGAFYSSKKLAVLK